MEIIRSDTEYSDYLEMEPQVLSQKGLYDSLGHNVDPTRPNDLMVVGEMTYGERRLVVTIGRNSEVVDRVVDGARQEQMLAMVPKDVRDRFKDPESFEKWYAKGRFLVSYWDEEGNLAAIDWYGESSFQKELDGLKAKAEEYSAEDSGQRIPELMAEGALIDFDAPAGSDDTFAIRLYEGFSGQPKPENEASSFARTSMDVSIALYVMAQEASGRSMEGRLCWLETNLNDKQGNRNGAVFLYEKAGYRSIGIYMNPDPSNVEWRIAMVKDMSPEAVYASLEKIRFATAA